MLSEEYHILSLNFKQWYNIIVIKTTQCSAQIKKCFFLHFISYIYKTLRIKIKQTKNKDITFY